MNGDKIKWIKLEEKFPPVYKRVLITVLDDEGKRQTVTGMYVRKTVVKRKLSVYVSYWLYDADDVFITSGEPGKCSKPIAWAEYPEPYSGEEA